MFNTEFINRRCAIGSGPVDQQLQRIWWTACLISLLVVGCGFSWLYIAWQLGCALRWLLQAAVINAYVLWLLWKAVRKNYHPDKKILLPHLGYANWLTFFRGILIGLLAGFLFQPWPYSKNPSDWISWVPGGIYMLAVILDYADGYIARITRHETYLGEWLDPKLDALGLLIAPVLAVGYNRLPIFYISVSVAYYLFQFGTWHRKRNNKQTAKLKPQPADRMIAGFQMGLVAIALFPVFSEPAMSIAAIIFMVPLLAGFLRDWLIVCGYVKTDDFQRTPWDRHINLLLTKLLPVFLRVIIIVAVIGFFDKAMEVSQASREIGTKSLLDNVMSHYPLEALIIAAAGLMIALGIVGRIAALTISVILAGTLTGGGASFSLFLGYSCAVTLLLTGSGFLSIWHPEDKLLLKKQGKRTALNLAAVWKAAIGAQK